MKEDFSDRNGFIRKVYGILTTQLLVTTIIVGYSMQNPTFIKWQIDNVALLVTLLVLNIVAQCSLICSKTLARRVPINYLLLAVITVSESYLLSLICSEYEPESVFNAFLATLSGFIGMSFYALTTKTQIDYFGSITYGCFILFFCSLIAALFLPVPSIFLNFFIALFSLIFIAVDTAVVLDGAKYGITTDDYIKASLILYLDFIELFIRLL
jgi:FtsH-binding integral membrane protein